MIIILPENILLVDKPAGITSFDCILILRKKLGVRKMGHAGTLDPMATGLMIIGIGNETKALGDYLKLPKTYEAEILLGIRTDTGDITGRILEESKVNSQQFSPKELSEALSGLVGKLSLPVPAYSAIKRGGEPLYKKARRGEKVYTPIKEMEVKFAHFLGLACKHGRAYMLNEREIVVVKVRFDVSSGTYIRSLAEEFGRRLARTTFVGQNLNGQGVPATLAGLRRTRIGEFKIEDAQKLDNFP